MEAKFCFVPRSVSRKPSKAQLISRSKPPISQKTSKTIQPCVKTPLINDHSEEKIENPQRDSDKLKDEIHPSSEDPAASGDESTSDVVYFSKNQRWPEKDEPVCVVCGRYGEFICDLTEADVCSKECKARNLKRRKLNKIDGSASRILTTPQMPGFGHGIVTKNTCEDDIGSALPKNFTSYTYTVHPEISLLTKGQVKEIQSHLDISIQGEGIARPILEFCHCGLSEQLLRNLKNCGYITPTPVQMQVIPVALTGQDLLACAQTGSGKTAGFLVPLICRISYDIASNASIDKSAPQGLVLAPTRELCMQIETQAKELMLGLPHMKTALIVGGVPIPNQIHRLQQGVQVVFATPGRLAEIVNRSDVDLSHVKMLIIDEVDVLVQMGFENQVQSILEKIPKSRQTLLLSATIPPSVERVSSNLLTKPAWVSVGSPSAPNMDVKQVILWVEDKSKKKRLFALLKDSKYFTPPVLVFVDSRIGADMLSEAIEQTCDVNCTSMHGEKVQVERTRILTAFLAGEYDVLVCTGVLGRGLDLRCVKQVINFDMPSSVDEYIHQIGRAGRLGSRGLAVTFINNSNKSVFLDLVETVQSHGVKLPDELLNSPHLSSQQHKKRSNGKRKREETYVNRENLMDMLKKSTFRRRLKDR